MGIFRYYLTLILFSAGLLAGVQGPNFVDQYEKRIDAHLLEARAQLSGFIGIADTLYDGDMERLIQRHAESRDAAFQAEHQVLLSNYDRLRRFEVARGKLNVSLPGKILQILLYPEKEIMRETTANYSAAFPLTVDAILCGLAGALAVCVVFELFLVTLRCFGGILAGVGARRRRKMARRKAPARPKRASGKRPGVSVISMPDR